jgi:hypothetical protein
MAASRSRRASTHLAAIPNETLRVPRLRAQLAEVRSFILRLSEDILLPLVWTLSGERAFERRI